MTLLTVVTTKTSVDRETFERSTEDELRVLSVTDQVLGFLAANDDRAFKAAEVATRTGLDEGAVSTALPISRRRTDQASGSVR